MGQKVNSPGQFLGISTDGRGKPADARHNVPMDRPPIFAPAALLAAASAWTIALAFGEPTIGTQAAAVASIDLLVVSVTAIVAMVVGRSRWSRRFALVIVAAMVLPALTMQISNNWIIALLLSGLALTALSGPSLDRWLRPPAPGSPPSKATVLPLILLLLPVVVALAVQSPLSVAAWVVIVGAPLVAWAYSRGSTAGLWAARILVPAAILATLPGRPWWSAVLLVPACAGVVLPAWSSDAARAVQPVEGRAVPMPAELTPPEVLAAAGLDERGRPIAGPRRPSGEDGS